MLESHPAVQYWTKCKKSEKQTCALGAVQYTLYVATPSPLSSGVNIETAAAEGTQPGIMGAHDHQKQLGSYVFREWCKINYYSHKIRREIQDFDLEWLQE